MVNPGSFKGPRKEFLMGEKPSYATAVQEGYIADIVSSIQRRYLKRFPIDLPHNVDPTPEELAAVDDEAPIDEPEAPDQSKMTTDEYKKVVEKMKHRSYLVDFRKAQIKRWLAYQYMKDNDVRSKEHGQYNPYAILMQNLTGKICNQPRLKSPANLWHKDKREVIEDHLNGNIELANRLGKPIKTANYAALRDKIVRELFGELNNTKQRWWREQAANEQRLAEKAYLAEMSAAPPKDPESRQRSIQGLTQFMQPILDLIGEATGWKVSIIAGGPEPAHDGRLNTISIHSGYTTGDVKMTFGRSERGRYKADFIPMFGRFLKKCYSPDECQLRALSMAEGYMPMCKLEGNGESDNVTFHTIPDQSLFSTEPSDSSLPKPSESVSVPLAVDADKTGDSPIEEDVFHRESSKNPFPDAPYTISLHNTFPPSPPISHAPSPQVSRSPLLLPLQQPSPPPDTSAPVAHIPIPIVVSTPQVTIATSINTEATVEPQSDVQPAEKKSTKRKKTAVDPPPIVEPRSKRIRTKSIRAIDAEVSKASKKTMKRGKVNEVSVVQAEVSTAEEGDKNAAGKPKGKNSKKHTADTVTPINIEPPAKRTRVARATKSKHR